MTNQASKRVPVEDVNVLVLKQNKDMQFLPDELCITWPLLQFLDFTSKSCICEFA